MRRGARFGLIVLLVGVTAVAGWIIVKTTRDDRRVPPLPNVAASIAAPSTLSVTPASANAAAPANAATVNAPAAAAPTQPAAAAPATPVVTAPNPPDTIPAAPARPAVPAAAAPNAAAAPGTMEEARQLITSNKKFEARAVLTKLILSAQEGPARDEMRGMLDLINREIFFSRAPSEDAEFYEVQPGDALSKISTRHGKDVYFSDLLLKINGMTDPRRLRAGQKIKIPKGEFSALVQKRPHRLIILFNGAYIKEYLVALGAPASPTPTGTFKIANTKQVNPDWYAPDGNLHKFGDPANILGTRWIGFENTETLSGYGIHGTSQPETVGQDVSNGCVRMRNSDAEEVFTMLMPGNRVEIVP